MMVPGPASTGSSGPSGMAAQPPARRPEPSGGGRDSAMSTASALERPQRQWPATPPYAVSVLFQPNVIHENHICKKIIRQKSVQFPTLASSISSRFPSMLQISVLLQIQRMGHHREQPPGVLQPLQGHRLLPLLLLCARDRGVQGKCLIPLKARQVRPASQARISRSATSDPAHARGGEWQT